LTDCWHS